MSARGYTITLTEAEVADLFGHEPGDIEAAAVADLQGQLELYALAATCPGTELEQLASALQSAGWRMGVLAALARKLRPLTHAQSEGTP